MHSRSSTANACEEIGARIRHKREDWRRRIGGRSRIRASRPAPAVEKAQIRLETPNPGAALPIKSCLRADGDAWTSHARRIEIEDRRTEAARRLEPFACVERKAAAETCADIHAGPIEDWRRRLLATRGRTQRAEGEASRDGGKNARNGDRPRPRAGSGAARMRAGSRPMHAPSQNLAGGVSVVKAMRPRQNMSCVGRESSLGNSKAV